MEPSQRHKQGKSYAFARRMSSKEYEAIYVYDPEYANKEEVLDETEQATSSFNILNVFRRGGAEPVELTAVNERTDSISELSTRFIQQCTLATATSADRQKAADKFDSDCAELSARIAPGQAYSLCRAVIKTILMQRTASGTDTACQLAKHAVKICHTWLKPDSKRIVFTQCSQALVQAMEFQALVCGRFIVVKPNFVPTLIDIHSCVTVGESERKRAKARDVAWCARNVAYAYYLILDHKESLKWLESAKSVLTKAFPGEIGEKRSQLGHLYHDEAGCYESSDPSKAEESFLRAIAIFEQSEDWPTGRLQDEKPLRIDITEMCLAKLYMKHTSLNASKFIEKLQSKRLKDVEKAFNYIKIAACQIGLGDVSQATVNVHYALSIFKFEASQKINYVAVLIPKLVMMTSVLCAMLSCLGNHPSAIRKTIELTIHLIGLIKNGDYQVRAIALFCKEMFDLRHLPMPMEDREHVRQALEQMVAMIESDATTDSKATAELKVVQTAFCRFYLQAFEKMFLQTYGGELKGVKLAMQNIIRDVESGLRSAKSTLAANQCRAVGDCYLELAGIYARRGKLTEADDHLKGAADAFRSALDWESEEEKNRKLVECASFDLRSFESNSSVLTKWFKPGMR